MDDVRDKPKALRGTGDRATWPVVESVHVGYLTLAQAAHYLAVSKATVRRWIKNLGLPHYYLPGGGGQRGKLLFRKGEVDRWMRRHKNGLKKVDSSANSA